ncbi:hypothetical protein OSB04_012648 [Centaurea solstitialis]|uniref:Agenet domain-containing protein n=1 Tax=Centaurea solstitialis TaxID=347529 RepID=A0AA38WQ54_9ASTR|nr:hypothetical protein OSB04_012648 [Centaurea solstitialis]
MVIPNLTKGSRVEVSSNDAGFHGAWYVATILDEVEIPQSKTKGSSKHKSKKSKKIEYKVQYDSLVEEDDRSKLLTENVEPSFVRPLAPRYTRLNVNVDINEPVVVESEAADGGGGGVGGGGEFELFDVVDAYHLDGWWIGVVTKVVVVINGGQNNDDDDKKKYMVTFETPAEEVEFEKSKLRLHVDWIDGGWILQPKKTLEQEFAFINAVQTSKSNDDAHLGLTKPSDGAIVADPATPTVGSQSSSKKRSSSRKVAVTHGDTVGGPDYSFTYIGNKRNVRDSLGRFRSPSGSKGKTEVMVPVVEASGSQAEHQDSLPLEQEKSITETCEVEASESPQRRKRGRPPKSPIKLPNGLLEDNQESRKRVSFAIPEMTTELDEQPLSAWCQGLRTPTTVSKSTRGSRCSPLDRRNEPSDTLNPAIVNNSEINKYHQELPFIKRSSMWATIESLEVYQNPPQKPHFSLLKQVKEDFREGLAIAYFVTFANLVQRISKLKLDDPNNGIIEDSLETLVDLETHGFDVGVVRARLNELLSRKAKVGELREKLKQAEEELEKQNLEKSKIDEEISQLEAKMQELKEKVVESEKKKNVKDEEIKKLQSDLHQVANQIMGWKVTFEKLATSPL